MTTYEEAIEVITQSYNDCEKGFWYGADKEDLKAIKGFALHAVGLAESKDWDGAERWAKRCILLEKKVGFKSCPIWGEFYECVQQVCKKITLNKD